MGGKDGSKGASKAYRHVSDVTDLGSKATRQDSNESATTTTGSASMASRASSDLSSASGGARKKGKKGPRDLQISSPMAFQHAVHIDEDLNWTGEHVNDLFKVEGVIGKGAFGKVFKARNTQTDQVIAIKEVVLKRKGSGRLKKGTSEGITRLDDSYSDGSGDLDEATKREISKEIDLLKKCSSPFIVQYYGSLWKPSGTLWILMEFCELGSVRDVLEVATDTCSLREEQIATILYFTLKGLEYLHSRDPPIAHFDIKTNNLLISSTGHVKLADFGLAQQLEGNLASVGGTPHWMAPELLLEGEEDRCGPKSDIWALGITAIEMAEGDPPYGDVAPAEVIDFILDNSPPRLGMKYITELAKLEKEAAGMPAANRSAIKQKIKATKKRLRKQQWSERFMAFLEQCLQFHPDDRPSAAELLQTPFIKAVASKQDGGTDSDDAAIALHKLIKKWHANRSKTKKRLRKAKMDSAQIEKAMAPSSCVSSSSDDEEGERSESIEFSVDPSTDESLDYSAGEVPKGTPVVPDTSTSTKRTFKAHDSSSNSPSNSPVVSTAKESPTKEAKDPSHDSDDMWATDSGDELARSRISARLTSGRVSSGSGMESSSYVSFEAAEMDQIKRSQESSSPPKPSPKLDGRATATSTTPLLGTDKKSRSCCACVIS